MDDNITDLPEKRLQKRFGPRPEPPQEAVCPTCKHPLASTSHGWIRQPFASGADYSIDKATNWKAVLIPCPLCSGGVEAKRSAQLIIELFGDAHIPWYAKEWNFGDYLNSHADEKALGEVKEFVRASLASKPGKRGLYLVGTNGLCKTSMAISALQYVIRKGHPGCFITTAELFAIAKEAIAASVRIQNGDAEYADRYEASKGAKLLRLVKSVEWLVLDDLGVECGSKYEIRELYLILEARRSQGLYSIFTSNLDAADLHRYWRHAKEGVYEDSHRVIARLGEYCFSVPVKGQNTRVKTNG